jgi:hypothetical protein
LGLYLNTKCPKDPRVAASLPIESFRGSGRGGDNSAVMSGGTDHDETAIIFNPRPSD